MNENLTIGNLTEAQSVCNAGENGMILSVRMSGSNPRRRLCTQRDESLMVVALVALSSAPIAPSPAMKSGNRSCTASGRPSNVGKNVHVATFGMTTMDEREQSTQQFTLIQQEHSTSKYSKIVTFVRSYKNSASYFFIPFVWICLVISHPASV